jgi:hypothetical protein
VTATGEPPTPVGATGEAPEARPEHQRHGLEKAGLIVMGIGGGLATIAIALAAAFPGYGSATALLLVGVPGLIGLIVGFVLWIVGKTSREG